MLRKIWFQAHWLLGITAGVVLALMGVTGATLSFETELLRALNPGLMSVPAQDAPMLTPPQLLARIAAAEPQRSVGTISVSNLPGRAARVGFLGTPREGAPRGPGGRPRMDVFFADPYTGALLGHEDALRGHDTLHFFEDVHRRLAAGDVGKAITGASTVILIVLAGSGLYLRWPRRWKSLDAWFSVRWRLRKAPFLKSLHEVIGTWLLLPVLLVALTGLWWSYEWYRNGLLALTNSPPQQRPAMREAGTPPATPGELDLAWQGFLRATASSGYSSATFNLPAAGQDLVVNYLDREPAHERANNRLTLSLADASVKAHERYRDKPAGQQLTSSVFVLHKGSYFGLAGTLVMLLASLAMPLFAITGWMLYLQRRRRGAKRAPQPAAPAREDTALPLAEEG